MTKAKIFHAGQGKWEVRYRKKGERFGEGYFFPKRVAQQYVKQFNQLPKKAKPNNQITKLGINAVKKIGGC